MSNLREALDAFTARVRDLSEHVRGNEQATKMSLIGPLFTMLGYDLTDPRECLPEFKADFGKDRSNKPIDWAFKHNGTMAFFVEAKEVGKKLGNYDEQLGDYFAKDPNVKLGVLTNGVRWRFFTDADNANVMDHEPFAEWDVLADENPPFELITLLQKSQFNPELFRALAQRKRNQNLLVQELTRLLEPSDEFTRLAVANIETRKLTQGVLDGWKPIMANAIQEWARQRTLTAVLTMPPHPPSEPEVSKVVTTQEELDGFASIAKLLGSERPVECEDTATYFKLHVAGKRTWVFARLQMDRKNRLLSVPLPAERVAPLAGERVLAGSGGWTSVALRSAEDVSELGELVRLAHQAVTDERRKNPELTTSAG